MNLSPFHRWKQQPPNNVPLYELQYKFRSYTTNIYILNHVLHILFLDGTQDSALVLWVYEEKAE
jgi:hypothetical protein